VKSKAIFRAGLLAAATCLVSVQALAHDIGLGTFSTAVPVTEVNSPAGEGCPIETPDGLSLLFASNRPGGAGGNDIWVADRATLGSPWQAPRNIGDPINSSAADFCPTPAFGRSLFFVSERLDNGTSTPPCGGGDIYLTRQSPAGGWSAPVMLKCAPEGPNFTGAERSPSPIETWFGTFLFYSSSGDGGDQDIYMSRMGPDGNFGPGRVVKELSTPYDDIMPNVRARDDGSFEIVFSSNRPTWGRNQPAKGQQDVYIAQSWWLTGLWTEPRNLGDAVNTAGVEQRATLSADGKRMYFGRDGDIFVSRRSGQH
jgi:WD40-like Beta Propeller Repeat